MSSQLADLRRGDLKKQIFIFSLPLMLSNLLQVLFNMSDIAVVGRFAGHLPLGSVGSTTVLVSLFTGFLIGLGNGVNVICAKYMGARNVKELQQTVHTSLILCIWAGFLILIAGQAFSFGILKILHTKKELIEGAQLYLRIYFLGMPALAIYNFGNGILSASGDTKTPLKYLFAAGVINVILNLFFVIGFGMDVDGVAIASVISQYISAALILRKLFTTKEDFSIALSELSVKKDKALALIAIGIPAGIQNAIFNIANLFIQSGVNRFDAITVSANAAAANVETLVYNLLAAYYTACGSFIGQNYGAGNKERILKSYLVSLTYSVLSGLVLGLTFIAMGPKFLLIFTDEAAVVAAGMKRVMVMGASFWICGFMDNTIAASRGLGKSLVPTAIVISGSCLFRIFWVYTVFARFTTIEALYSVYPVSWAITSILEILYFRHTYKNMFKKPAL